MTLFDQHLTYRVARFGDLRSPETEQWRELQQNDPTLSSAFFSPDFAGAVDSAGRPVCVAIISQNDCIVGVFPFHRKASGVAAPVGGPICDFHGIIGPIRSGLDFTDFLRACDLYAYDFNHLPASQDAAALGAYLETGSPYLDLKNGFEAYLLERAGSGTRELKNTERKRRKLEREIGPIRFQMNDKSDSAWQAMLEWKNRSYERMGLAPIRQGSWVLEALNNIRATESDTFSGMLSSAYAGDRLAAVHFGMRSHASWHWWFPTYDPGLDKFSPGLILLLELARRAPDMGLTRIDLGRGDERYKTAFASATTQICEGSVERPWSLAGGSRRGRKLIHRVLTRSRRLDKITDFQRRAFNRLLGAGRLPD